MRTAKRVTAVVLVTLTLAVVAAAVSYWQEGYRLYTVRTGSMTPTYPPGTLLVDAPPAGTPRVGQVITFAADGHLVSHRVHAVTRRGIETKGDANRTPDVGLVTRDHVVADVVTGIKNAGFVLVFLRQPSGIPSLVLLALSVALAWSIFFAAPPRPRPATL